MNVKKIMVILAIITVAIAIDQVSKSIVEKKMPLYASIDIIGNIFQIRHIVNRGFINSIGSGLNNGTMFNKIVIITLIALIVLIGYFIYLLWKKTISMYLVYTFSILIGGALGNFMDRLLKRYVVDFFEINFPPISLSKFFMKLLKLNSISISIPVFNCADFFISTGITMLLIYYIFLDRYKSDKKQNDAKNSDERDSGTINKCLEDNQ